MEIYKKKTQILPEIKVVNIQEKNKIFPEIKVVNIRETTQIFPDIKVVNLQENKLHLTLNKDSSDCLTLSIVNKSIYYSSFNESNTINKERLIALKHING